MVHPAGSGGDSSRRERAVRTQDEIQPALLAGDEDLQVVGESFRQDNLRHLTGYPPPEKYVEEEIRAVLVAEKDNPYDPNAIAVWIKDPQAGYLQVGYLSRENIHALFQAFQQTRALVVAREILLEVGGECGGHGSGELSVSRSQMRLRSRTEPPRPSSITPRSDT